eukprot:4777225-Pleurochrysis_carterae.AAC.3
MGKQGGRDVCVGGGRRARERRRRRRRRGEGKRRTRRGKLRASEATATLRRVIASKCAVSTALYCGAADSKRIIDELQARCGRGVACSAKPLRVRGSPRERQPATCQVDELCSRG